MDAYQEMIAAMRGDESRDTKTLVESFLTDAESESARKMREEVLNAVPVVRGTETVRGFRRIVAKQGHHHE